MFGAFLPVLAATDAAQAGGDDGKARSGVSAFPREEPSDEELREWLKRNLPLLRQSYGAAFRNVTPSHLVKCECGAEDLSDYTRIVMGSAQAGTMSTAQVQQHNRRVDVEIAAVNERKRCFDAGMHEYLDGLAQVVVSFMQPHAPLRLVSSPVQKFMDS